MRTRPPLARISFIVLTAFGAACASSNGTGGTGGSGGSASGTGGNGTGGTSTGGTQGTGGTTATGGVSGTGGLSGTGGVTGTGGGGTGTGGSGTGGATGTGGSAGHGGSAGGGGGASATGGSAATGGAGGAVIFSDDFESDTSGKQPAGWDNIISYNYKTASNPMGSLSALADATKTHNSSKLAAHIVSDGSMVLLERALPSGTNHLFFRAYIYLKNSIGNEPTSSNDNHETLLGLTMTPNNGDNQIRFGQIKGAIGTNSVPSDDISPPTNKWNMGMTISAGMWHCIEVEFDGTGSYSLLNAWSDSTLVHSIASNADWAHGGFTPGTWLNNYFNSFMFGWQSFSSMANEVWVDDLVLSTARVGCN